MDDANPDDPTGKNPAVASPEASIIEALAARVAAELRETQQATGEGSQRSRLAWRGWRDEDTRLLFITFAGTIAANLATVLIVALAVLAERYEITQYHSIGGYFLGGLPYAVLLAIILWTIWRRRGTRPGLSFWLFWIIGLAAMMLTLLTLIGIALGVK
jgi:hypothetical protein